MIHLKFKPRNKKFLIGKKIIEEACKIGQQPLGFCHRVHRTKKKPSGRRKMLNLKRNILEDLRDEEDFKELKYYANQCQKKR